MNPINFEEFVIFQKSLELLERFGLNPMDVTIIFDSNSERYRWIVRAHGGTSSEQMEQLQRLREALSINNEYGQILSETTVQLYSILCDAIAKAPKSFTRYR